MKNVPDKIYLQIDADGETPEDFKDLAGVSWCEDKIHDNDIEYVLKSPVGAAAKEEQAEWEFLQIIRANYEICKRGDGSEWKGYSPQKAAIEIYEDLISIIDGLPLKRQKSNPGAQGQEERTFTREDMINLLRYRDKTVPFGFKSTGENQGLSYAELVDKFINQKI